MQTVKQQAIFHAVQGQLFPPRRDFVARPRVEEAWTVSLLVLPLRDVTPRPSVDPVPQARTRKKPFPSQARLFDRSPLAPASRRRRRCESLPPTWRFVVPNPIPSGSKGRGSPFGKGIDFGFDRKPSNRRPSPYRFFRPCIVRRKGRFFPFLVPFTGLCFPLDRGWKWEA